MTTKGNYGAQQIDGPRTVVRHVRCTKPALPTLPVFYDPSTPEAVCCIECGQPVEFASRGDPIYQLWLQDRELLRVAWAFLEGDGWGIRRKPNSVPYEAVKGANCRMIVVRSGPPLRADRPIVAANGSGRFPTIQVVPYSEAHYSDFKAREDVLAERGVPVLWIEHGRVVEHWNYPPSGVD